MYLAIESSASGVGAGVGKLAGTGTADTCCEVVGACGVFSLLLSPNSTRTRTMSGIAQPCFFVRMAITFLVERFRGENIDQGSERRPAPVTSILGYDRRRLLARKALPLVGLRREP